MNQAYFHHSGSMYFGSEEVVVFPIDHKDPYETPAAQYYYKPIDATTTAILMVNAASRATDLRLNWTDVPFLPYGAFICRHIKQVRALLQSPRRLEARGPRHFQTLDGRQRRTTPRLRLLDPILNPHNNPHAFADAIWKNICIYTTDTRAAFFRESSSGTGLRHSHAHLCARSIGRADLVDLSRRRKNSADLVELLLANTLSYEVQAPKRHVSASKLGVSCLELFIFILVNFLMNDV